MSANSLRQPCPCLQAVAAAALMLLLQACAYPPPPTVTVIQAPAPARAVAQAPAPAAPANGAPQGTASPPQAEAQGLEQLVGRIALYPDDLVAVILPASTNPLQIVQAERFLEK